MLMRRLIIATRFDNYVKINYYMKIINIVKVIGIFCIFIVVSYVSGNYGNSTILGIFGYFILTLCCLFVFFNDMISLNKSNIDLLVRLKDDLKITDEGILVTKK